MANAFTRILKPSVRGNADMGLFVLRVGFGLALALGHGLPKLLSFEKFAGSVTRHGFPFPGLMAPIAMSSELVGGALLALGLATRPAALFVMSTMLGAVFVAHAGDPFKKKELALAYALVALVLLVAGPGRHSLDARLAKR